VDLADGGTRLEIRRCGDDVVFRALDPPVFAFRHALARGADLARATAEALAADPAFELGPALAALFGDGLPIALGPTPSTPGDAPCQRQP
jgi:hypothetical protein